MITEERRQVLIQEARRELARRHMSDFVLYVDRNYQMNWHHQLLCEYLDRLAQKEIRRLMVFMPPRHGKSELVSRKFPAFLLGNKPDTSIISCSYASDLASRMNRDVQRLIDSPEYEQLFPNSRLFGKNIRSTARGSYLRNSDIFEIVNHRGVYRSAGVGGGITGMGGEYIVADDPVKNREEADSATYREKVYNWYTSTLYTRLEKDGCILLTLTRWHEDDLAGKLLKASEDGAAQPAILELPAICEEPIKPDDIRREGEALWKWKYDESALAKMKATVGSRDWAALYQRHPTPGEGGTFKREWWNCCKVLPSGLYDYVQSWDRTFKACAVLRLCGRSGVGTKGKQPLPAGSGARSDELYRDNSGSAFPVGKMAAGSTKAHRRQSKRNGGHRCIAQRAAGVGSGRTGGRKDRACQRCDSGGRSRQRLFT